MLNSVYIKENHPYSKDELYSKIKTNNTTSCIKKLKEYGILKTIKKKDICNDFNDLCDDDYIVVDEEDTETTCFYTFNFVGVIIVDGVVLKCYPKYIFSKEKPHEELKQIIKVLDKYNAKNQIIKMHTNHNMQDNKFNRLAAIICLLNNYYENGLYSNFEEITVSNGNGEINWNKTVNETFAILKNNRPYYTDLKTKNRIYDEQDYIKRLHECIITMCSKELSNKKLSNKELSNKELEEHSLSDLFGLDEVYLSEEEIENFGDKDFILYQIQKELNVQFNTNKQTTLQLLYMFVENSGSLLEDSCFTLYGTTSFYCVWEKVCANILNNQLDNNLLNEIEKPVWVDIDNIEHVANKTLIPDIVSFHKNQFIIFDAKYYNLILQKDKQLSGNPGVSDVAKQYLYQLAFKSYISDKGFEEVKNCFLMPTEENQIINKGFVKMKMFEDINLCDIQIRQLPAKEVYNLYLQNKKLEIEQLNLN